MNALLILLRPAWSAQTTRFCIDIEMLTSARCAVQDVALTITYTDCDGVDSRQAISDVKLVEAGQVMPVPLATLSGCSVGPQS